MTVKTIITFGSFGVTAGADRQLSPALYTANRLSYSCLRRSAGFSSDYMETKIGSLEVKFLRSESVQLDTLVCHGCRIFGASFISTRTRTRTRYNDSE